MKTGYNKSCLFLSRSRSYWQSNEYSEVWNEIFNYSPERMNLVNCFFLYLCFSVHLYSSGHQFKPPKQNDERKTITKNTQKDAERMRKMAFENNISTRTPANAVVGAWTIMPCDANYCREISTKNIETPFSPATKPSGWKLKTVTIRSETNITQICTNTIWMVDQLHRIDCQTM